MQCTVVKCNFPIHLPVKIWSFFGHLGVPSTQINLIVLIYTVLHMSLKTENLVLKSVNQINILCHAAFNSVITH